MKTIDPLNSVSSDDNQSSGPTWQIPEQYVNKSGPSVPDPVPAAQPTINPAADLIRNKLEDLYQQEPDAKEEVEEVSHLRGRMSKHQRYMQQLTDSGKPLADIQTEWHTYYVSLSDAEKHEVWQEFYAAHQQDSAFAKQQAIKDEKPAAAVLQPAQYHHIETMPAEQPVKHRKTRAKKVQTRTVTDLKQELVGKVEKRSRAKLKAKHHLQSLAFGLAAGAVVVLILLFGFFNERFIAPFITPSRNVSATPIIVDPNSVAVGTDPKVIIPKINVEIPVVYDEPSISENAVQTALERGVIHYATTPNPGEKGNTVIFGHSSNNILNKGKYKFAFVLLSRLDTGDTFYLQKDGKRYAYRIFEKKIVKPTDTSVLDPVAGKVATATLITCDPPGTSLNRLIVVGEQISPDPNGNAASTAVATSTDTKPATLAGNSPSLWSRITGIFR